MPSGNLIELSALFNLDGYCLPKFPTLPVSFHAMKFPSFN
jgi:hypothetical protein